MTDLSNVSDEELRSMWSQGEAERLMPHLIQQESGGRPGVTGPQTPYGRAQGMTQMLPATAQQMASRLGLPWRPELMTGTTPEAADYQSKLGQAYLAEGIEKTGTVEDGLRYYHGGPDRNKWGPKTDAYAADVQSRAGSVANMSDEDLRAEWLKLNPPKVAAKAPAKPKTDQLYGLEKGAVLPWARLLDRAAVPMEKAFSAATGGLPERVRAVDVGPIDYNDPGLEWKAGVKAMQAMPTAAGTKGVRDAYMADKARRGIVPGKTGEFVGNMVATAPLPGGPVVQGALSGALLSEGKSPGEIARDAAIGAAGGKLGDVLMKGVGKGVSRLMQGKTLTPDNIGAAKEAAYAAAEKAGVTFNPNTFKGFVTATAHDLKAADLDPDLHKQVSGVMRILQNREGQPLSLKQVDQLRRIVRDNIMDGSKDEQRLGKIILNNLDEMVSTAGPSHVLTGDPKAGAAAVKKARELARRSFIVDDIQSAVERAQNRASVSGTGGNVDNAIRQELRKILENTPGLKGHEKAALHEAMQGSTSQNILRLIGRLSPTTGGLQAAMNLGATAANPLMAVPGAVGLVAKTASDNATKNSAKRAAQVVAQGGATKTAPSVAKAMKYAGPLAVGSGAVLAAQGAQAAAKPVQLDAYGRPIRR